MLHVNAEQYVCSIAHGLLVAVLLIFVFLNGFFSDEVARIVCSRYITLVNFARVEDVRGLD